MDRAVNRVNIATERRRDFRIQNDLREILVKDEFSVLFAS